MWLSKRFECLPAANNRRTVVLSSCDLSASQVSVIVSRTVAAVITAAVTQKSVRAKIGPAGPVLAAKAGPD